MGLLGPQGGQFFEATDPLNASTWDDWNWYLEKTFSPGGDLAALRDAVLDARRMSGDNALRAKLVLMVPFPSRESFPGTEAQKEALRLYMEQMKERYQPFAASDALELCALYWLHEDDAQEELIRYAAALTHAQGLRFLWIPFFNAHGFGRWKDLGFDSAILQPNHFFNGTPPEQIPAAAALARQNGMGLELEFDERAFEDAGDRLALSGLSGGGGAIRLWRPRRVQGLLSGRKGAPIRCPRSRRTHGRTLYEKTFEAAHAYRAE